MRAASFISNGVSSVTGALWVGGKAAATLLQYGYLLYQETSSTEEALQALKVEVAKIIKMGCYEHSLEEHINEWDLKYKYQKVYDSDLYAVLEEELAKPGVTPLVRRGWCLSIAYILELRDTRVRAHEEGIPAVRDLVETEHKALGAVVERGATQHNINSEYETRLTELGKQLYELQNAGRQHSLSLSDLLDPKMLVAGCQRLCGIQTLQDKAEEALSSQQQNALDANTQLYLQQLESHQTALHQQTAQNIHDSNMQAAKGSLFLFSGGVLYLGGKHVQTSAHVAATAAGGACVASGVGIAATPVVFLVHVGMTKAGQYISQAGKSIMWKSITQFAMAFYSRQKPIMRNIRTLACRRLRGIFRPTIAVWYATVTSHYDATYNMLRATCDPRTYQYLYQQFMQDLQVHLTHEKLMARNHIVRQYSNQSLETEDLRQKRREAFLQKQAPVLARLKQAQARNAQLRKTLRMR